MLPCLLTIFTPTYNRAHTLPRLYDSLCRQTNKNFKWLIVDDGSEDDTKNVIKKWKIENKISIKYLYQTNGGKMRAHNRGVLECDTELFLCVDSDDYLVDNATTLIYDHWNKTTAGIIAYESIAGIIAYKAISGIVADSPSIVCEFPKCDSCTMFGLYEQGFKGDTSLVYRTSILQEHLFPEIEGEKFIGEDYIYNQIDEKYQLSILREPLIVCEYLPDGYTCNWNKLYISNPKGWAMYYNQKSKYYKISKHKLVLVAYYIAFSIIGHRKHIVCSSESPWLTLICLPLGVVHYLKKKKLYSKI